MVMVMERAGRLPVWSVPDQLPAMLKAGGVGVVGWNTPGGLGVVIDEPHPVEAPNSSPITINRGPIADPFLTAMPDHIVRSRERQTRL